MEIRISVLSSGQILLDGKDAELASVASALEKADANGDFVLYYRENPQGPPPLQAKDVFQLIVMCRLPVRLCTRPDFSDFVDQVGQSHPGSADAGQPPADALEPRMPDVSVSRSAEDVFAEARQWAAREGMAGGVVIVRPDRGLLVLSRMSVSRNQPGPSPKLPNIIPARGSCDIAVISNTWFTMLHSGVVPPIEEAGLAIPFLGFLIGWSQAGHRVWVFEGHPSALAAGLRDSEFLLLDSGMLPFLQPDWMAVARRTMKPGGKVFLHEREKYRLVRLTTTAKEPGWRFSEADGEASYVNCLLTTMAKGDADSATIVSGEPLPELAAMATDPDELDWIAGLPFRYDLLDARKAITILISSAARGKANDSRNEWVLTTRVVLENGASRIQRFAFRRERSWLKTILHISKA